MIHHPVADIFPMLGESELAALAALADLPQYLHRSKSDGPIGPSTISQPEAAGQHLFARVTTAGSISSGRSSRFLIGGRNPL